MTLSSPTNDETLSSNRIAGPWQSFLLHPIHRWLAPVAILVFCAYHLGHYVDRLWIPNDEGTLAHTAQRVLAGEIPHRDYDEPYSGGLTYLNAASFTMFGMELSSLRYPLWLGSLLFLASMYALILRFASPWPAAGITFLCLAWGMPHSFSAMPSWYNLIFAGIGLFGVFRFVETENAKWLLWAGVCGGLSFCFKIIALYYLGAVLLLICYWEQTQPIRDAQQSTSVPPNRSWYSWLVTLAAIAYVILVVAVMRHHLHPEHVYHFFLPNAAAAAFIVHQEWTGQRQEPWIRWKRVLRPVLVFLGAAILPISIFVSHFAWNGALDELFNGLFVVPQKRVHSATFPLPKLIFLVVAIPWIFLWFFPWPRLDGRRGAQYALRTWAIIAVAAFVYLMFATGPAGAQLPYRFLRLFPTAEVNVVIPEQIIRNLPPFIVLCAFWTLATFRSNEPTTSDRRTRLQLATLAFAVALCSLVQYPFAAPMYFLYFAPLFVVMTFFLLSITNVERRFRTTLMTVLFIVFSVLVFDHGLSTSWNQHREKIVTLNVTGARLNVLENEAACYEQLVEIVQKYSSAGDYIYAAPDCPEVYYVCQRRNPTRTLYDIFDEPEGRIEKLLAMFSTQDIPVVVENVLAQFSPPLDPKIVVHLRRRYSHVTKVQLNGRDAFHVWHNEPSTSDSGRESGRQN